MANEYISLKRADDAVRVGETPVGKGVFALRSYPAKAVVGEIAGDLVTDGSRNCNYTFEMDEATVLDPYPPFRYLNHCCEPNCEFDSFDETGPNGEHPPLYLIALRDIQPGEELTIDYNWPAENAIVCGCQAASCRGWIVSLDELHLLSRKRTRIR
jgi:hypothetical protein